MKILMFGAGENAKRFLRFSPASDKLDIVGIVDNDSSRWGKVFEEKYTIDSPSAIQSKDWDKIAVTPASFYPIMNQLITEYGIEREKIIRISDFIVPGLSNLGSICLDCDYNGCYETSALIPDKVIPSNKLEQFYFKNKHRIMNKWWHYFDVYQTFFGKYVGKEVKILEIGVYKGGSVQMWKEYFGKNATVVGVDIDERCKAFEEENVHICIGSQADKDFLTNVSEQWGPFDIILDDGSHIMEHQIVTFETLFPLLKEGGVFICEDCHSSYSPRYGGEYKKTDTFIEYSKNFVDYVNSQFINFEAKEKLPSWVDYINACHYYDSMVVIEKKYRGYSFFTEIANE